MEGKWSTQNGQIRRFLLDVCQLIMSYVRFNRPLSELENLWTLNYSKIVAWNATEIVRFLKLSKFCFFFRKNRVFSKKTPKSLKLASLLYNAYKVILFLKNVSDFNDEVFLAKNQKNIKVGKNRNYDEECIFILSSFYKPSFQKWNAQNMPVVGDRLVHVCTWFDWWKCNLLM